MSGTIIKGGLLWDASQKRKMAALGISLDWCRLNKSLANKFIRSLEES